MRTAKCIAVTGLLLTAALANAAIAQERNSAGAWPIVVNAPQRHTKLALAAPPVHRLNDRTGAQLKSVAIDVIVAYTKKSARNYSDI